MQPLHCPGPISRRQWLQVGGLAPQDVLAMIYRHLGIDYKASFNDFFGRPVPILSSGAPMRELI